MAQQSTCEALDDKLSFLEVAARAGVTSSAAAPWPVTRGQMPVVALQAQNRSIFGLENISISTHISRWLESCVETFSLSWLFFSSCLFVTIWDSDMDAWPAQDLLVSKLHELPRELVEHSNSPPGRIRSHISIINASKLKGLIFWGSSGGGSTANSGLFNSGIANKMHRICLLLMAFCTFARGGPSQGHPHIFSDVSF